MFRHQFMFVLLLSMLLLTHTYANELTIPSRQSDIGTLKNPMDFKDMMSAIVQIFIKHTISNPTGPLSVVRLTNKYIVSAKKSEKELFETYEEILRKKGYFEELQQKVKKMSSVGSNEEINQMLEEVQAIASKGFKKMNEIDEMKKDFKQAIVEAEIACNEIIAFVNKSLLSFNSIIFRDGLQTMDTPFNLPAIIVDAVTNYFSASTNIYRLFDLLNKLENNCNESKKYINDAVKELQEIEATQKSISAIKQPLALGVKDAHGSIMKDSTSVPSLLSTFAYFAGVMMFTVMSTNYL